ncbi:NAD(P)/FAD-dependent oxidoreductase [Roseobacter sp. S98]|uniref:NAD(P)/FAD-dependent oxidoreductase n=1 Tax=Roseobacter algicola (ex Choi et al. 2025) (nom. illeg.) TaxID=3092138 RepID=UPI003F50FFFF
MSERPEIAVIGAGLAGVHLARLLSDVATVTVFEKSRGIGGRMSTRRAETYRFDHGAQYFTARGNAFLSFLEPFVAQGYVAEWNPRLAGAAASDPRWNAPRFVGVPAMNSLAKAAASGLDVRLGDAVENILPAGQGWRLACASGAEAGPFDIVLSTAPAFQTAALLPGGITERNALDEAKMLGCYSLMLGFDTAPDPGWDAFVGDGDPLAWIAANHSKPGRDARPAFLCQTGNTWAEARLERDQEDVRRHLLAAFTDLTGIDTGMAEYVSLHRWRYAAVQTPAGRPYLFDPGLGIGAAGDWCGQGRVEAAFDSAGALASAVRMHLSGG